MENNFKLYEDIAKRTDGDIYVGVVGPVLTRKSIFIKRFMDLLVITNIDNTYLIRNSKRRNTTKCRWKNDNEN